MKIEETKIKGRNIPKEGFKEFKRGERNHLHPNLAEIDDIDCRFLYDSYHKIIFVEYNPKDINGKKTYTKQFLSSIKSSDDIHTVSKDIIKFTKEDV